MHLEVRISNCITNHEFVSIFRQPECVIIERCIADKLHQQNEQKVNEYLTYNCLDRLLLNKMMK